MYLLENILEKVVIITHDLQSDTLWLVLGHFLRAITRTSGFGLTVFDHQLELERLSRLHLLVDHLNDSRVDDHHLHIAFPLENFGILAVSVTGISLHDLIQIFAVHVIFE